MPRPRSHLDDNRGATGDGCSGGAAESETTARQVSGAADHADPDAHARRDRPTRASRRGCGRGRKGPVPSSATTDAVRPDGPSRPGKRARAAWSSRPRPHPAGSPPSAGRTRRSEGEALVPTLGLVNIGALATGILESPRADVETIRVENGRASPSAPPHRPRHRAPTSSWIVSGRRSFPGSSTRTARRARRLHAAPEDGGLPGLLRARHHLRGVGGRGSARARPAARPRGRQGAGHRRRQVLRALPPEWDEGQRGIGGARARADRRGLRRDGEARGPSREVRLRGLRAAARRRGGSAPRAEAWPLRHVPQRRHVHRARAPSATRCCCTSCPTSAAT